MFDCNGCCFADSDGDQQVGCKAQKHECVGFSKARYKLPITLC